MTQQLTPVQPATAQTISADPAAGVVPPVEKLIDLPFRHPGRDYYRICDPEWTGPGGKRELSAA